VDVTSSSNREFWVYRNWMILLTRAGCQRKQIGMWYLVIGKIKKKAAGNFFQGNPLMTQKAI